MPGVVYRILYLTESPAEQEKELNQLAAQGFRYRGNIPSHPHSSGHEFAPCLILECQGVAKSCACGADFIDKSKNGTRRWCSMKTCGNRSKVRAHRARNP